MSAAAAPTVDQASGAAPASKGKKKLVVIVAAALLFVLIAGGGAAFYLKKRAAAQAAEAGDDAAQTAARPAKPDLKHPPTFLPLDPFVINLADKETDRYAQIGITFEVADARFSEEMKAFMPAIRNGILMILSHKSSRDLLDRAGKEQLAAEILRDASRTMGIDVGEPEPVADTAAAGATAGDEEAKAKPRPKADAEPNPIRHVHFSNFIVQ